MKKLGLWKHPDPALPWFVMVKRPAAHALAVLAVFALLSILIGMPGCTLNGFSIKSMNSLNPFARHTDVLATAPTPSLAEPPSPSLDAQAATVPSASVQPEVAGEVVDSVVASVDGNPITSHDIKDFNPNTATGIGGVTTPGGPAAPAPDDPNAVLKALITQRLLEEESRKFADKVDDDEIDRYIQNIEARNHVTDDQLRAQLQQQGMSYDAFRRNIRQQVEAMTMIDKEVRQKVVIPDSQIEAYYKEHSDEFKITDERYRLAQILIAVPPDAAPDQVAAAQKKAEDLRQRALKGEDFGDLARQYSDDDSKSKGGELGFFGPNDLNDDIARAITNLKPEGISDVARTKYGFHIVKVEEHHTPGVVPLAEVKGAIRDKMMTEQAKAEFQKWIDTDLARHHNIETNN